MERKSGFGFLIYVTIAVALGFYFAFAAIRGELGVLERLVIDSDLDAFTFQRDELQLEVDDLVNKTRRLSDNYLDVDLLDERARSVLGYLRGDELVIR
ncbi:MAG: septum formation initiator family protein [Pseudomonadota bacterium]